MMEAYIDAAARDLDLIDQAVSDLMRLAMIAGDENDYYAMTAVIEFQLRPELGWEECPFTACHYYRSGEYGRALPFYQMALTDAAKLLSQK